MTLVAKFQVKNWPVLVGDIMISAPAYGQKTEPLNIPTHANVNARLPPASERIVSGLVQKAIILNPRLALAWAGSLICARSVFRDILQRNQLPTFGDVASVLNERRGEAGMDLYVTGICLEEAQGEALPAVHFAWDSDNGWEGHEHVFPEYGACYAGGSGADVFLSLLGNPIPLPTQMPAIESVVCLSLGILGKLAGDQMRSSAGIVSFFGGAFEIVTLLAGQLKKIGDVAYHFWQARSAPNAQVEITLRALLRIAYFEDYLVIRKLEFGGEVADVIGTHEVYVIPPVHRLVDDAEKARLVASVPRPSMNAEFNVFYVHLPEKQAPHDTYVSVHKSGTPGESQMIAFEETGVGVQIQIDLEVFRRVQQALTAENTK